jgi:methionyl-tRNA formyltransferase
MRANTRIGLLCNNRMAIPAMQQLLASGSLCAIAASDRNQELNSFLKMTAEEYKIPFRVISRAKFHENLADWLATCNPDAVFVMTFPWRIPQTILDIPTLGFFNFHYGLLPEMRGADPIFESIRQQRKTAGLSVHIMDEDFDTGPVVLQELIDLQPNETYGTLSRRMAWLGEKLCRRLLENLNNGTILPAIHQDRGKATYWPRIPAESLCVKWEEMTAGEIKALVNACNPIAKGVPVTINDWKIGLCAVAEISLDGDASRLVPGSILALDTHNGLLVFCKDGKALKIEVIYTEEGVFPGHSLSRFGLSVGMQFN